MERELWPVLYRVLRATAWEVRQKYVHHPPWVIAAVLLWAALHDRPVCWACDPRNWSTTRLRPPELPSAATVSRRVRRAGFAVFLNAVTARVRGDAGPGWELIVDGKPLVVGGCSKDRGAKRGRGAGQFARGYKLHAVWGDRPLPEAWAVTPLNRSEAGVAEGLMGEVRGKGYLLADGNYDSGAVFDAADAAGYQLIVPMGDAAGGGHRVLGPARSRGIGLWRDGFGPALYRERAGIERRFGNAVTFGGGMGSPPAWVRGIGRVERWVWCKLHINAARILHRQQRLAGLQ